MSNAQFKSHYSSGNAQLVKNYQDASTPIIINCVTASVQVTAVASSVILTPSSSPIVINCVPASTQITAVSGSVILTQSGGGTGTAQFVSRYLGADAQLTPNYDVDTSVIIVNCSPATVHITTVVCAVIPESFSLSVVWDIECGNINGSTVSITDPSGQSPVVYVNPRSTSHESYGWRHFAFAVENANGKTPVFQVQWSNVDGSQSASNWFPVITTDHITFTQASVKSFPGTPNVVQFSFSAPLPSGRVYVYSSPIGRVTDSINFANELLATHSAVAAPTGSGDSGGVVYTLPSRFDDVSRQVGNTPIHGIKLSFPGPTTDGLRKRKAVFMNGIHSAGEAQSWYSFKAAVNWILTDASQAAVDFRANWDVYLYFLINPAGVKGGHSRWTFYASVDPNRTWTQNGTGSIPEVNAVINVIKADVSNQCDAMLDWHGDVYRLQDFICVPPSGEVSAGTRTPPYQSFISNGTAIFGSAPYLSAAIGDETTTSLGWAKAFLSATISASAEHSARWKTTQAWYKDMGEKWVRTLQAVDADGLFVQSNPNIVFCSPASITATGQLAQVILTSSGGGSIIVSAAPGSIHIIGATATVISGGSIPEPPPVNTNYPSWLNDQSAIRCILVEVQAKSGGSEVNRFLSSRPFKSASSDIPVNTVYNPIVVGSSVRTVERLDITSNAASISFGDIEVDNHDGSIDSWLGDIWSNRAIRVYLGDVRWTRAEFQQVFDGVVEDIGSRSRATLNLKLRDKLQRLNTPVTEATLGGTTNNKNQLLPLLFGECHNITPLLTNPATLEYQTHNGIIERIVEIRDNGVPVSGTTALSTGKFTLNASPAGKITCTAQGDKPSGAWNNTTKKIIERLVTAYGEPNNRFTSGDLDTASLSAFDSANTQTLGVYLSGRENVISVCNRVASTVGARLVMTRDGKLRLVKVELPPSGTPFEITDADVITGSLYISNKLEVKAGVKLAYCKNWSVQEGLDTRIPSSHKVLYTQEWLMTVARDNTVKSDYRIDGEPEQEETLFLTEAHASAETTRLLNLFKTPRYIVNFKATARLFQLQLGHAVTLTYPRFGMDAGKSGMVIGLSPDWDRGLIDVEIFL